MAIVVKGNIWPSWVSVQEDLLTGITHYMVHHEGRMIGFDQDRARIGANFDAWNRVHALKAKLIHEEKILKKLTARLTR